MSFTNFDLNFQEGYCADYAIALLKFLDLGTDAPSFALIRGDCQRGRVLIHCYLYSDRLDRYFDSESGPEGVSETALIDRMEQWLNIESETDEDAIAWIDYEDTLNEFRKEIRKCGYKPNSQAQKAALLHVKRTYEQLSAKIRRGR